MTGSRTQVIDAGILMRDLLATPCTENLPQREINVSFRQNGNAVGRRDYATHWVHWYPAKMFHRIPSEFMDTLGLPTPATILDPYCGSGTVLLEANLRGHDAIGIDVNPLATLISRVKTTPLDPLVLQSKLDQLVLKARRDRSKPLPQQTLDYWIAPPARVGLHRLGIATSEVSDVDYRAFFQVALTNIVRRVSLADPAIPPLVRLSERRGQCGGPSYRIALQKSRSTTTASVYSAFFEVAAANIRRMGEFHALGPSLGRSKIAPIGCDATNTGLPPCSVDVIITSPPYCGSQKYVRSLKLELILSGFSEDFLRDVDRRTLGTEAVTSRATPVAALLMGDQFVDNLICAIYEKNPVRARMASDYSKHLSKFARECRRVLRPGGNILVTLGRSKLSGVTLPADRILQRFCESEGMELVATLVDVIPSRGLLTKRHNTAGRIDHEFIAWLRLPR